MLEQGELAWVRDVSCRVTGLLAITDRGERGFEADHEARHDIAPTAFDVAQRFETGQLDFVAVGLFGHLEELLFEVVQGCFDVAVELIGGEFKHALEQTAHAPREVAGSQRGWWAARLRQRGFGRYGHLDSDSLPPRMRFRDSSSMFEPICGIVRNDALVRPHRVARRPVPGHCPGCQSTATSRLRPGVLNPLANW